MAYDWSGEKTRRLRRLKLSGGACMTLIAAFAVAGWKHLVG